MTKHYELTYTSSKNLLPEEADSLLEKIASFLPQAAALERGPDFISSEFYAEPETLPALEEKLKSEPQIKNYMITKKEALKPIKARRMPLKTRTQEQKVEKVEMKEIDKKLKEIFGE